MTFFLITLNAYAFEELTACIVFGDFKRPQTWTCARRQCANPEGVQGVQNLLENNKFYRKKQLGPIILEKIGPLTFFYPPTPLGLWKNYSFFVILKKLSGLFSTSWARTAHHNGENSWIHARTHVADKHARVFTCILLYVGFVFGNYRSSYVMVKMIRGWKTMGTRVLF